MLAIATVGLVYELPTPPVDGSPRFLDPSAIGAAFAPVDLESNGVVANRLDTQALVAYYADEWGRWEER